MTSQPMARLADRYFQNGIRTAGMILNEGIGKGPMPTVDVLSIGATVSTRQSSDLLPYMAEMKKFFAPLPKTVAEMTLRPMNVPLTDVETVTKTVVKVRA